MTTRPAIGLIGAGMMGGGMARSLMRTGHAVTVFAHRERATVDALLAEGASEASDLAALVAGHDVLLSCVPDASAVEAIAEGVAGHLRPGLLWIDATTSDPVVTRRVAAAVGGTGATFADAPVTGGPPQAECGKLTSLVGCPETAFDRVRDVVGAYSKAVFRFGETGTGHTAKLLNNLVSQGTMMLLSEAFNLATRHGVAWEPLAEAMRGGAAQSGTLEKAVLPALEGDFDGSRFTIGNAAKDLRYAAALLDPDERGWTVQVVRDRLEREVAHGRGQQFVSRLLQSKQ
ncbi:NAD(P)-dependent oxidoreductase [Jannaschia sp. S6380]|uniref:NAD(P)-dependent oxidoreductase n=1 Tax=Jannaschia sp. S6380 TaxID=2926408 RepID=UPI001FF4B28C|nr:NAD(P)-dependent oxidoreductase [Jannaschia sp. S6380]MCK0167055.1 NAD(P)-dependent oxidoreductase [Jannaschia sp. S6380]